jgi:hypothetical protein
MSAAAVVYGTAGSAGKAPRKPKAKKETDLTAKLQFATKAMCLSELKSAIERLQLAQAHLKAYNKHRGGKAIEVPVIESMFTCLYSNAAVCKKHVAALV